MVETCLQHSWSKPHLDSSGCREGLSPVAVVAGLMWTNLQTTMMLSMNCRSIVFRSWALLKMSWKQHKGTPKWALEMYLIEQQGWWHPCRCWTLMTNCLPLWKYLLYWLFLFIFKFLFFAWDLGGLKPPPPRLCRPWDIVKRKLMLVSTGTGRVKRFWSKAAEWTVLWVIYICTLYPCQIFAPVIRVSVQLGY